MFKFQSFNGKVFFKKKGNKILARKLLSILMNMAFAGMLNMLHAQAVDHKKIAPKKVSISSILHKKFSKTDIKIWQKMIQKLQIKVPDSLSPIMQDPNKPSAALPKKGHVYLHDSTGRMYIRSPWGNWTNYDESKADNYTLPDPLTLNNGLPVKSTKTWRDKRRPQILKYFSNDIYGRIPENTPRVSFQVVKVDSNALNGTATVKEIVGHINNTRYSKAHPEIQLKIYFPVHAEGPYSLLVKISPDLNIYDHVSKFTNNPLKQVLSSGWAFAVFNPIGVQDDNAAGLTKGIIGLMNKGKMRKPNQWGTLAAWSWGLSKAFDYFETDSLINHKKIGIQGHSRWGKTALVAAALDQRWDIVFSSCSGAMGASLGKRNFGETIDNTASPKEFHWMAGNFLKYANHWNQMPVDAHELIALAAPRPVFITGGTRNDWTDAHGEFLACLAASPVYRLLDVTGLETKKMPAPNVALTNGRIAFREHIGGHTDIPDWPVFLKFAKKYF